MDEREYTTLRTQVIQQLAGASITPLASGEALIGYWEMRFRGLGIAQAYQFRRNGEVQVDDEIWGWNLQEGTLSFLVSVPPDPTVPGLEEGATSEECFLAFKTEDGRIVLSNADTSLIGVLTKVTQRS